LNFRHTYGIALRYVRGAILYSLISLQIEYWTDLLIGKWRTEDMRKGTEDLVLKTYLSTSRRGFSILWLHSFRFVLALLCAHPLRSVSFLAHCI
jgi:hypothetical protein